MLSQESVPESFLEKLKKRIRKYLWLYLKVIGPQREIHSSCGLHITKFHSLLHFPFYIDKFGSPSNFFGGYRESSLRPTVKSWISRTAKQHSRIQQDVMSRYYESLAVDHIKQQSSPCHPSSNHNEVEINMNFGDEMYKLSKHPFLLVYTAHHGWHTHTTHRWSCTSSCGALYHPCKRDTVGKSWVKKLVDYADSLDVGVDRIGCHMECYVPTNRANATHDILRCNPNYRRQSNRHTSWHDWVIIRWSTASFEERDKASGTSTSGCDIEENIEYSTACRLLLWGNLYIPSENGDIILAGKQCSTQLKCVVHSMKEYSPKPHPFLPFVKGDVLEDDICIIDFSSIQNVAFVLPGCPPANYYPSLKDQPPFPDMIEDQKYFIIIPERSDWNKLGWKENDEMDF
jgi:hypothetical protein